MEKVNLDRIIAVRTTKTIYRYGDTCIKAFGKEYSKEDVLGEALNQARIERLGLNVPKILGVTAIEDQWAIVSEYISGKTLAQLMQENPEKRDEYLELLVDTQMEVHTKTCPLLPKLKDLLNRGISETELDATVRYSLHASLESMPRHVKVCHGDFVPSNIIIAGDGTPYILDWSRASQGNASADAVRTYQLFCMTGDEAAADKYLELFCSKSGTAMAYVRKWFPIVAAAQSVQGNAAERAFMLELIKSDRD